jgi:hypothetical protein
MREPCSCGPELLLPASSSGWVSTVSQHHRQHHKDLSYRTVGEAKQVSKHMLCVLMHNSADCHIYLFPLAAASSQGSDGCIRAETGTACRVPNPQVHVNTVSTLKLRG